MDLIDPVPDGLTSQGEKDTSGDGVNRACSSTSLHNKPHAPMAARTTKHENQQALACSSKREGLFSEESVWRPEPS